MILSGLLSTGLLMKKAAEKVGVGEDDYNALSTAFGKAKSISAKASKYILQYPVACSDSISEYATGLAIAKQVEFDCARFYILASGLDPVIDATKGGNTIAAHLDRLTNASEDYKQKTGFTVKISMATEDDIARAQEALTIFDVPYVLSKESTLAKTFHSRENTVNVDDDPGDDDTELMDGGVTSTKDDDPYKKLRQENANLASQIKNRQLKDELNKLDNPPEDEVEVRMDPKNIERLGKSAPTVINIELILNGIGGQRTVKVPLAFKSDLQFIPSSDIRDLLKSVNTPGKGLRDFIKLTSGEMNFFKDFIFALDDAKKDTEKERLIGRVPIFRQLLASKNRYRIKSIVEGIPLLGKHLKDFVMKKQKDLPMCTVVVTDRDFELGTGVPLNKALNGTSNIINYILDTYMLLGFAIIDNLNEVGYFFYSGEDGYYTIKLNQLASNGGNNNISDKLAEALASMTKMMKR